MLARLPIQGGRKRVGVARKLSADSGSKNDPSHFGRDAKLMNGGYIQVLMLPDGSLDIDELFELLDRTERPNPDLVSQASPLSGRPPFHKRR
jgi:hypothetical protein